ncbi:MAG: phosphoribosylanthranilate isomerase [Aureliella sp.]
MSTIKICGFTDVGDVDQVGAITAPTTGKPLVDIIGLNFVPSSPRCVDTKTAKLLAARAQQLGMGVAAIVMNPEPDFVARVIEEVPLDFIQLHGTEDPSVLPACGDLNLVKALSWSGRTEEAELAMRWSRVSPPLQAFLVDAYAPSEGGGTGRTADWGALWPRPAELNNSPMWLAGGLRVENVAAAIRSTRCAGVDTASGVESSPGRKDPELVRAFAQQSVAAFASLAESAGQP